MVEFIARHLPNEEVRAQWSHFFWSTFKFVASIGIGIVVALIVFNWNAGPGSIIIAQGEAEGARYRDPDTIDLVSKVTRNRNCPAAAQRYAWRWETPEGDPRPASEVKDGDDSVQHLIPLAGTVAPFLSRTGTVLVTVSARDVPDRLQQGAGWMYRIVTNEKCPPIPEAMSQWFASRLTKSNDMPLNFVGAPHGE